MFSQYPMMINLYSNEKNIPYNCDIPLSVVLPQKIENQNNNNENQNNYHYFCKDGCNILFKSLQKKIAHHNRLDEYCNDEKTRLYILLNEFKFACDKLMKTENLKEYQRIKSLEQHYKKAKKSALDKNLWSNFLV